MKNTTKGVRRRVTTRIMMSMMRVMTRAMSSKRTTTITSRTRGMRKKMKTGTIGGRDVMDMKAGIIIVGAGVTVPRAAAMTVGMTGIGTMTATGIITRVAGGSHPAVGGVLPRWTATGCGRSPARGEERITSNAVGVGMIRVAAGGVPLLREGGVRRAIILRAAVLPEAGACIRVSNAMRRGNSPAGAAGRVMAAAANPAAAGRMQAGAAADVKLSNDSYSNDEQIGLTTALFVRP